MAVSGAAAILFCRRLIVLNKTLIKQQTYFFQNTAIKRQLNALNIARGVLLVLNVCTVCSTFGISCIHWGSGFQQRFLTPNEIEQRLLDDNRHAVIMYHRFFQESKV